MTRGRGRQAPPRPRSEEERWLQMAESALFLYRLLDGWFPDDHDAYLNEEWYPEARDSAPDQRAVLRICDELVAFTDPPADSRVRGRRDDARKLNDIGYGVSRSDIRLLLEGLVEWAYERREAEL